MTAAVRAQLILTTDLERELAAKLAVANRYGCDRDREILALERQLKSAPAAAVAAHSDDLDRLRRQIDRVCTQLVAFTGRPILRDAAASQVELLIGRMKEYGAEIRRLQSECERLRDQRTVPDPDPVVYTIRESDFEELLDSLIAMLRAAWRERQPPESACATRS